MSTQFATVVALRPGSHPIEKCKGDKVNKFFPPEPAPRYPDARAGYEAKARYLCAGCPLAMQCLTDELERMANGRTTHGVFGGTAPWERKNMLRNARRVGYDLHEAAIRHHERVEAVAS